MVTLRWFMRGLIWGLFFLTLFNSCTSINIIDDRLSKLMYVDSALVDNLTLFIIEGKMRNVEVDSSKLTMIFSNTNTKTKDGPNIIGTCQAINGRPLVFIDKGYYKSANAFDQQELVYHELGHCLLGRDHCEVKDKNGEPVSLMEPSMVGIAKYSKSREEMVNELFKPNPECTTTNKSTNGIHSEIHGLEDLVDEE